jgi:branched-subunit amino acid transport protein
MTSLQIWLAILGMALVTTFTRALFLAGGKRMILPARLQRALRYAPAAALAAVVLPDLLATPHGLSVAFSNHAFYASLCGLAWYFWRRGMLGTIIVGMLAFTAMRLVG